MVYTHIGHGGQCAQEYEGKQQQNEEFASPANDARILVAKSRYHGLEAPKGAVQAKSDEHQKEYDAPEDRAAHSGYGLRIDNENQTRSLEADFINGRLLDVGHVAKRESENTEIQRDRELKMEHPYPNTEKMTKPARKLVKQLMLLVIRASR